MSIQKAKKGTMRRVLRYIGAYRFLLALSLLLALVSVVLTLWVPLLIGEAIDAIVGAGEVDFAKVGTLLLRATGMILATAAAQWLMNTLNNRICYQVVRDVRADAIHKIEKLPLSYLDTHPHGEVVSRVIADADQFADGLLLGFTQLFTGVMTILGTLVFMFRIRPVIALVVVVLTPISLFAAKFISSRTYSMFKLQSETRGEQTALIEETVGNQKVVLAFTQSDEMLEKFDEINGRLEKASLRSIFFSSLTNPVTRFVNSLVYAAVALTGGLVAIGTAGTDAAFTVGELTCLLSYTNQYTKPFNEISGVVTEFQNALACADRVFSLIEEPPEVPDPAEPTEVRDIQGHVALENVRFSYVPERPLIENFSLTVRPGERVAIVGPTGCGKTTLINLLMRFYEVDSGAITLEGVDIRDMTRENLRAGYGMVLQETWIASGTVKENIAIGKPDATEEEIVAAAKAAHAHSFIQRLPHGYDTVLNEGGGTLSEGQRQLLCITRVMLALPPMLILDEATSSIDTRTEIQIQRAFHTMMQGRTSFIVAHRLSTVREADTILVMRDGHVVEQGSHRELLARGGFYAMLYNSQFAH